MTTMVSSPLLPTYYYFCIWVCVLCVARLHRKCVSRRNVTDVYRWGRSEPKTEAGVLKRTALSTWQVSDTGRTRTQYTRTSWILVMWPVRVCWRSGVTCTHIRKGTDPSWLRKTSLDKSWDACETCEQEKETENEDEDKQDTAGIWMCLKCGHRVSEDAHTLLYCSVQDPASLRIPYLVLYIACSIHY